MRSLVRYAVVGAIVLLPVAGGIALVRTGTTATVNVAQTSENSPKGKRQDSAQRGPEFFYNHAGFSWLVRPTSRNKSLREPSSVISSVKSSGRGILPQRIT